MDLSAARWSPNAATLFLLTHLLVLGSSEALKCPVKYTKTVAGKAQPMLYGGLYDHACEGCVRGDALSDLCRFDPSSSNWGICTPYQRSGFWEYVQKIQNGAVLGVRPCQFFNLIRSRTLWVIGDSHTKVLFTALECFFVDYIVGRQECHTHTDRALTKQLNSIPGPGLNRCVHLPGNTRICLVKGILGDQYVNSDKVPYGGILPFLREKFASPKDIFVMSFGIWHRKEGQKGFQAYGDALKRIVEYYQSTKDDWPHLFFRETPMDHPKDQNRQTCLPHNGIRYNQSTGQLTAEPARPSAATIVEGTRLNRDARMLLKDSGIPRLSELSFNMSVVLNQQHVGLRQVKELDCLHYCNPGLPQVWVWELFEAFKQGLTGIAVPSDASKLPPLSSSMPCVAYSSGKTVAA